MQQTEKASLRTPPPFTTTDKEWRERSGAVVNRQDWGEKVVAQRELILDVFEVLTVSMPGQEPAGIEVRARRRGSFRESVWLLPRELLGQVGPGMAVSLVLEEVHTKRMRTKVQGISASDR